jgi:hypothetical protein
MARKVHAENTCSKQRETVMHPLNARLLLLIAFTLPVFASASAENDIDFDTEIIPILTRQGCNAGSCHGAAIGRGGFKLSLLGSGAAADYATIVHQLEGRRVNLHEAGRSLLLLKPSEQLGHEGGLKLEEDSPQYEVVQEWIRQGSKRLEAKRLTKLLVSPSNPVLDQPGDSISVSIQAVFDDGQTVDVRQATVLAADDPDAVKIDHDTGTLTVMRRGIHVVIARFLDRVVPIRITVPLNEKLVGGQRSSANQIDVLIHRQLDELKLPISPRATDRELLRRVTLDLAGRLPTAEEHRQFVADPSMSKLVDRLLSSGAYAKYWALKWANVLRIDSKQLQGEGAKAYHHWIEEQLRLDTPMTELATKMLTSLGDSFEEGQVNFLRTGMSPGEMAEHASKIFMGVRLRCANCHNHPLDHWQQDDYHGLAAIFAKVKRGRMVTVAERGEVTHPVTGEPAVPRIPGLRYLRPSDDGRVQFATWLTARGNPYLAKVTANRLWQQLMGRGLVEPVDDLRATNPATNPELLDWLADDFAKHGFRLKHTLKAICLSQAYQRSQQAVVGNESDTMFFSRAIVRPLEAEVIADAIGDVTGLPLQYDDTDTVRAIALTNNRVASEALDVLGRCDRTTSCAPGEASGGSLARTLHMINGPLINDRISDPKGRLVQLLERETDNHVVLQQLYQIALGQAPGNRLYWSERFAEAKLDEPKHRKEFFEDLLWSLLTSETFITNH